MPLSSMGRKGFEGKFNNGMRAMSHNTVEDTPAACGEDSLRQSCWANMPPELLRDVLMRIEESESMWQRRKSVVACAGACRSWRQIMKEIVGTLQESGKLTFPISLKQAGPRSSLVHCFIKRNRGMQSYHLYLNLSQASNDEGKFLLAARRCRRPTYTDYVISLKSDDVYKGSRNYIGKLRSNFLGTKFTIYDAQPSNGAPKVTISRSMRTVGTRQVSPRAPTRNYPVAHVSYELNVLGARGPRRMQCKMKAVATSAVEAEGEATTQRELYSANLDSFPSFTSTWTDSFQSTERGAVVLENKTPRWHDQLQCWCLNFNGRVTVASVKNFQLVVAGSENVNVGGGEDEENVVLQFGKVGKDTFTMDYQYPLSAFQAFALCLSSFDTKIACE